MKANRWAIAAGLSVGVALGACGSDSAVPTVGLPMSDERVALIYENNLNEATLNDTALALALLNLDANISDDSTAIAAANALLGTQSIRGEIAALSAANADYAAAAGTVDLNDVAVLLAAARPTATPLTEAALAGGTTALFGRAVLSANDIRAIPGVTQPPIPPTPSPFQNATSQSCANTRGVEALYWDYMNGLARLDYPDTIQRIPYAPGISFIHPLQPIYSFEYPTGWQARTLTELPRSLAGANVTRQDNRAIWRRLNFSASGTLSATQILDGEVEGMLAFFGNPQPVERTCFLATPDGTRASTIVRAGDLTANVSIQVAFNTSGFEVISNAFVQVAVAPTAQYADTAVNVFFPLTSQVSPRSTPQCRDNVDNDGDGRIDFPADPGCTSATDNSELF